MSQRLTIFLSIGLGLVLIGLWLYIVDLTEMLNIIKEIQISLMLPLGICFILMYFLRSLRWKIILSPVEKITIGESFNLCMTNYFINFLIPVHAGEVAKSLLLKKLKGTPVSKSLSTVYIDKVTDILPIFLLLAATPFLKEQLNHLIYLASGILMLILLLLILSMVFIAYKKEAAVKWIERIFFFLPDKIKMKLDIFLNMFMEGLLSMSLLSNRFIEITGLTILAMLVHCFFMWLFFYSFGIDLSVFTVLVGYLLLNATFMLPAPPGFAGTLELTFVFIFTYIYGYDKNIVSAVAASSHIFIAVLFGLFGFLSIAIIGTKLSTVLKMEKEAEAGIQKIRTSD